MSTKSCAPAIAAIAVAFPGKAFPDSTAEMYGRMLADLDPDAVMRAVERLIKGSEFMPTIHSIRKEVAEETLALPTPEQAWDIVLRGDLKSAAPEVKAASLAAGGRVAILHSDSPTTVRAQFLKSYAERRRTTIEVFMGSRPALPQGGSQDELPEAMGPTMRELPESAHAPAPPVNARWLRRMLGKKLDPPTAEEISHAIEILRDGPPLSGDPDPLYVEAERIHAEAGA